MPSYSYRSFVFACVGAYWTLGKRHVPFHFHLLSCIFLLTSRRMASSIPCCRHQRGSCSIRWSTFLSRVTDPSVRHPAFSPRDRPISDQPLCSDRCSHSPMNDDASLDQKRAVLVHTCFFQFHCGRFICNRCVLY